MALILGFSLQAQEWELVWSDEFSLPGTPDTDKWGYEESYEEADSKKLMIIGD